MLQDGAVSDQQGEIGVLCLMMSAPEATRWFGVRILERVRPRGGFDTSRFPTPGTQKDYSRKRSRPYTYFSLGIVVSKKIRGKHDDFEAIYPGRFGHRTPVLVRQQEIPKQSLHLSFSFAFLSMYTLPAPIQHALDYSSSDGSRSS